jgi:alkaline phosphatase D
MLSPIGRTRTLPAPNSTVAKLRLGYASCQNYEHGYFVAYKHMLAEDLDLVMFLGDYIYEYGPGKKGIRSHDSDTLIELNDYRKRYVLYKKDVNLQAMHAACPWLFTWDDHEVQNDYAGLVPGSMGPDVSDFAKRRASAYQAYYEHMPISSSALIEGINGLFKGSEMRIYGNFQFGKLANISVLDFRQYRDPGACVPNGKGAAAIDPQVCAELTNPSRTMLGNGQERWLVNILKKSHANVWNVVGQPTVYAQMRYFIGEKKMFWSDGWDGYPAARRKLDEQFIKNKVKNLVMFGGDLHENWVGYLKEDYENPASPVIGVEFCGTSISSIAGGAKFVSSRLEKNPHFIFADGLKRGYGVAQFTPKALTVTLRVVSNAQDEDATIGSLAEFQVDSGSNLIKRIS